MAIKLEAYEKEGQQTNVYKETKILQTLANVSMSPTHLQKGSLNCTNVASRTSIS